MSDSWTVVFFYYKTVSASDMQINFGFDEDVLSEFQKSGNSDRSGSVFQLL
jgi:hypothetical protein